MIFDIKRNPGFAPYGSATGKMLNGKYATARSAGNYLAGLNGATGKFLGNHISLGVYMRLAGQVHSPFNVAGPPYYGEIQSAGRTIVKGFNDGLKKSNPMKKKWYFFIFLLAVFSFSAYFIYTKMLTEFRVKEIHLENAKVIYLKSFVRGLNYNRLAISISSSRKFDSKRDYIYDWDETIAVPLKFMESAVFD